MDIYAFVNILFHLLTGSTPYGKINDNQVSFSVAQGILPQLPTNVINDEDPIIKKIKELMKRCQQYDPNDRPDIKDVETELASLLK